MVDRREEQRPVEQDRRKGERRSGLRCAFISGPREHLDENSSFYRRVGFLLMACGYDTPTVLGLGSCKGPDEIMVGLSVSEGFNESSILFADLTTPSEQVMHDLRFGLGEFKNIIVLIPDGSRLPEELRKDFLGTSNQGSGYEQRITMIYAGYQDPHLNRMAREAENPAEKMQMYSSAREQVLSQIFQCIFKMTLKSRIQHAEQRTREILPDFDSRLEQFRLAPR